MNLDGENVLANFFMVNVMVIQLLWRISEAADKVVGHQLLSPAGSIPPTCNDVLTVSNATALPECHCHYYYLNKGIRCNLSPIKFKINGPFFVGRYHCLVSRFRAKPPARCLKKGTQSVPVKRTNCGPISARPCPHYHKHKKSPNNHGSSQRLRLLRQRRCCCPPRHCHTLYISSCCTTNDHVSSTTRLTQRGTHSICSRRNTSK